jgi:hypothetical protein
MDVTSGRTGTVLKPSQRLSSRDWLVVHREGHPILLPVPIMMGLDFAGLSDLLNGDRLRQYRHS